MPKLNAAKILLEMKNKYGVDGIHQYPDGGLSNASFELSDDLVLEDCGVVIIINSGSMVSPLDSLIECIIANGVGVEIIGDRMIMSDIDHNHEFYGGLVGNDITDIMNMVLDHCDKSGMSPKFSMQETVGTGAIAIIPAALNTTADKGKKKNKKVKEASNSQISPLQLDH